MGAFFTNVHVRPAGDATAAVAAIVGCLKARATESGLVPCEEDAKADRGVLVGRVGDWIGVYDQATESQDLTLLDELARRLSVAAGGLALASLVHDSDHLLLRLFDGDELADAVEVGERKKAKMEAWAKLVGADALPGLRKAFASRELMAENTMADIAAVLGIPEERACAGYKYLLEDGSVPEGMTLLRFRRAVRPAYDQLVEGPPRLLSYGGMRPMTVAVDGKLLATGVARNEGGATRNFYLVAHGPAIEAGYLVVEKLRAVVGRGVDQPPAVYEAPLERKALNDGRPCILADFPEGEIPASNVGGLAALSGLDPQEYARRSIRTQIQAVVEARGAAPGEAELYVSVVPREARENLAHSGWRVTVAPRARKPLRGVHDDPTQYLALSAPDGIVALAVSTLGKAEAAPIAAEIVEKWSAMWPPDAKLKASVLAPDAAGHVAKPKSATLKVDKLAASAAWKKLRTSFATAHCLGAEREGERMFGDPGGSDGFGFGTSSLPEIVAGREAPTLQLVVSLRGRPDGRELLTRARELVDEFVLRARCVQAVVMVCRPPRATYLLHHTAYEWACGIQGPHTLHREWCARFLRGVSADGIWLGPELLERIDREALASLCVIEPVGTSSRLLLREGASVDELEAVLAAVLPSREDGMAAARAKADEDALALKEKFGVDIRAGRRPS